MKEIIIEKVKERELDKEVVLEIFKAKAYELYKMDWKKTHVSEDIERKTIEEYYEDTIDYAKHIDGEIFCKLDQYEDWLWENGYANGMIYVCFSEFIDCEFYDAGYMKHILSEKDFEFYLENFEYDEDSLDEE